ncbi:hypothetical protein BJF78_30235 [Pseudonocardia sp. CNS-139]|nr:hypothetical protein BJF78_30235 [Pseudonocardia sp. CNS-139]
MTVRHTDRPAAAPLTATAADRTTTAGAALALLRIATGFAFLWAFLDKTFGLGYATPAERAWVAGGSPTRGFLSSVEVGPFQPAFHAIAGAAWADWLFMAGMLGVGMALVVGVALRVSAAAGVVVMLLMWLAEFPLAQLTADGSASGSTNPVVDYHLIYALVLVVLAATAAGDTWGLGRWWKGLPFVRRNTWAQ